MTLSVYEEKMTDRTARLGKCCWTRREDVDESCVVGEA